MEWIQAHALVAARVPAIRVSRTTGVKLFGRARLRELALYVTTEAQLAETLRDIDPEKAEAMALCVRAYWPQAPALL